jgi:hypothetical protein
MQKKMELHLSKAPPTVLARDINDADDGTIWLVSQNTTAGQVP